MILADLLQRMEYQLVKGQLGRNVTKLVYDSRKVCIDSVFVCISGARQDAHEFVLEASEKGAAVIVVEKAVVVPESITVILVKNTRLALACMSAAYFGFPAEKLITIGITGTKGKTTTTYMVQSILKNAGFKTGLIGTIETIIGEKSISSGNTTPESYLVQEYFSEMVKEGCQCVIMEVSSQGLMLNRVSGFIFDYGIFTNLEPDHIGPNEHKDLAEYIYCKGLLFQQCKVGIVNQDDMHMAQVLEGYTCQLETFGFSKEAELRAVNMKLVKRPNFLGVSYSVRGLMNMEVEIDIPGKFSVYNSLSAIAICRHFGVTIENIQLALKKVTVKGRVEFVKVPGDYSIMIDYAHNAMSLKSLLTTLKEYKPKRLVCLFGCGGNRSKMRRYEMGEVSSLLADLTVITSDNPREEEPEIIIQDILEGVKKGSGRYKTIPDRKEAIRYCMEHGQEGDVIVLAGKGHEDYQEIMGNKYKMDERDIIKEIIEGR